MSASDMLVLHFAADAIRYALQQARTGLSDDTRLGLEAVLPLLDADVSALNRPVGAVPESNLTGF